MSICSYSDYGCRWFALCQVKQRIASSACISVSRASLPFFKNISVRLLAGVDRRSLSCLNYKHEKCSGSLALLWCSAPNLPPVNSGNTEWLFRGSRPSPPRPPSPQCPPVLPVSSPYCSFPLSPFQHRMFLLDPKVALCVLTPATVAPLNPGQGNPPPHLGTDPMLNRHLLETATCLPAPSSLLVHRGIEEPGRFPACLDPSPAAQ